MIKDKGDVGDEKIDEYFYEDIPGGAALYARSADCKHMDCNSDGIREP